MTEQISGKEAVVRRDAATGEPIAWWLRLVVVLGASLMAIGAVIALVDPAMLVSPHDEINGAAHIYAGYLFARNLVLASMLAALLMLQAKRALGNLMVLVGFIQLLDACLDVVDGRWTIAPGVFVFALVFLVGAARLCDGYPFWRVEAWRR
ncbi:MAG: hypothetical protein ABSB60_14290 [Terracidiphilus sp.]|jgi:hypothetical protein